MAPKQTNRRAYHLRKKEQPGQGVRRIVLGRTGAALEGLRRAKVGADPVEEVHAVRKDLKKARSALRLARGGIAAKRFDRLNGLLRDAGRGLSDTRDAEVKAETLEALIDQFGDDMPGEETMAWRAILADESAAASSEMTRDRSAIESAIAKLEEASERLEAKPIGAKRRDLLDGLGRAYADGREAMATAKADPTDENFHEWRKRAKDLWYQLRILKKAWEAVIGETADAAHELADYLGDHHDLAVLAEDLATRDLPDGERAEIGAVIEGRQRQLEKAAFRLGERLYAEKPKAFRRRLGAYWQAWR